MNDPEQLHAVMEAYREAYRSARQQAWIERLGLDEWNEEDELLVRDLQQFMYDSKVDHVPLLRHLGEGVTTSEALHDAGIIYAAEPDYVSIDSWIERWLERTSGAPNLAVMQRTVHLFSHRVNWVLQLAIDDAERGDWNKAEALAARLMRPFER